jgi:rhodanese-related sulfurtransferase
VTSRFVQVRFVADCILVSPREHPVNWKRIPAEAAAVLIAAIFVGAGTNSFRPEARKVSWILRVEAPPKDPALLYLEITDEVALRLHRAGAIFIDARRSNVYEQGHIRNAISIPVWEHGADDQVSALQAKGIKSDAVIVVYCSGGNCEDAGRLAVKLAQATFFNVYVDKDGFPTWQSKGWPITWGKQR